MSEYKDYFSRQSAAYARFRPHYPPALFEQLAALPSQRRCAWDCATGSGQAARGLSPHFAAVIATDASQKQLAQAQPAANIHYLAATAEQVPLAAHSVDLITVAQALHWFDRPRFYAEARRVLRPGGVLCAWTYAKFNIDAALDPVLDWVYADLLGPYWPPERQLVDQAYRTIEFPFAEIEMPPQRVELEWNLAQVLGYLSSWSAVSQYRQQTGTDPLPAIETALRSVWGDAAGCRTVRWPLHLRAGYTADA